jgi:hypothetical protein
MIYIFFSSFSSSRKVVFLSCIDPLHPSALHPRIVRSAFHARPSVHSLHPCIVRLHLHDSSSHASLPRPRLQVRTCPRAAPSAYHRTARHGPIVVRPYLIFRCGLICLSPRGPANSSWIAGVCYAFNKAG